MLAFAILLAEFGLSGRFRSVSRWIGMDVTMRLHQQVARLCLALILIHPFLYRADRNPPAPFDPTRQLSITWSFDAIWSGALAFCLIPSLILLSINREAMGYRYENWRVLHGLGAMAVAGLTMHHTLAAGRYADVPAVAAYWWALFSLAGLTMAVVYLWRPLRKAMTPWTVTSVRPVAERTWQLDVEPAGHKGLRFRAGQFAWISVGRPPVSLADNPFSIASAPGDAPTVSFVIKELGDFTATLGRIAPGTRAYLDAPHGTLTVGAHDRAPGIALIAGGVGIAPMLGILRQMMIEGDPRPVVLLYGNRHEGQIVAAPVLDAAEDRPETEIVHVLSDPDDPDWPGRRGLIDADLLRHHFDRDDRRAWRYVLCGPPAMLASVERELAALGVPRGQILSEKFVYD